MAETVVPTITPDRVAGELVDLSRLHFVGIGGAGMLPVARVCAEQHLTVSGSDLRATLGLDALTQQGATVHRGHRAKYLPETASAVVFTHAIDNTNPEIRQAQRLGIPLVHRSAVLNTLMSNHQTAIAVMGTHGKTSTSGMLAFILSRMGMSPSYVVGGDFDVPGSGGHAGKGGIFVAEVDESDRSHIGVTMSVAVIMNIDHDHPEVYAGQTDLVDAYEACIRHGMREGGTLVLNADSAGCRELAARLAADSGGPQVVTFGTTSSAHWRLTHVSTSDGRSEAVLRAPGGREFDLALRIPGVHQLLNAAAAIATVDVMGQDCEPALEQLSFFDGMRRRMTPAGEQAGVRIFDSYAHHPEEVSADLSAARSVVGADGRVLVVFQPSGHARLDAFGAEFGKALAGCDQVVLTDWTRGLPETALERLAGLIDSAGGVARHVRADRAQAVVCAAREARPGDVVVLMGSGDIAEFGPALLAALDSVQPAAA